MMLSRPDKVTARTVIIENMTDIVQMLVRGYSRSGIYESCKEAYGDKIKFTFSTFATTLGSMGLTRKALMKDDNGENRHKVLLRKAKQVSSSEQEEKGGEKKTPRPGKASSQKIEQLPPWGDKSILDNFNED